MAKKTAEPKIMLEREYIVPLRRKWLKVAKYKRANKAVKALKEFIARHMKIYDRDLRKVKIDVVLNNELRFRGSRKPPAKIKIKAIKFDNEIVRVEPVEIPEHIKFLRLREKKKLEKIEEKKEKTEKTGEELKKQEVEKIEKPEEIKKEEEEKKKEEISELKQLTRTKPKEKHISKEKKVTTHRVALKK